MRKIKYQNWVYEYLADRTEAEIFPTTNKVDPELERKVRQALSRLAAKEKILIEQFYFQGRNYQEIAQILRLNLKQVEYLHRKAVFKLKNLLAEFVKKRFKIRIDKLAVGKSVNPGKTAFSCVICQNPRQKQIEELIESKKEQETWGVVLKKLKNKFNLDIKAPQVLMGHMKHRI